MFRRLFLVFLPTLTASTSFANEASWNCEQNKDTKEWVCMGDANQAPKEKNAAPAKSEKAVQPALTETPTVVTPIPVTKSELPESDENTRSIAAEPSTTQSTPKASVQPVLATPREPQAITSKPVNNTEQSAASTPKSTTENTRTTETTDIQSGWNCNGQKGDTEWNCQLAGATPNSSSEPVTTASSPPKEKTSPFIYETPMLSLLEPAFSRQQEQVFTKLTSQLAYNPWESCNAERGTKQNFVSKASERETAPLEVKSNYAEMYDNEIGDYSGNVKMSRADQQSVSEKANYNSISQILDLHGDVYYREDELALHTNTAMINLATDQAKLRDTQFIAATAPLRGRATLFNRKSKTLSEYKDVAYTSCRPGNQDWVIHSGDMTMDKVTGQGIVKNAWMEFKGTPVLYTPYLAFPIDNRRLSGFLMPSFGNTKYSGFRFATPYYWNIAPNYDATITPREMTTRGFLLSGQFRYLTEQSRGKVGMEFMPNDSQTQTTRYLGSIKNTSTITQNIHSNLDLNYVSDKAYFAQLGSALSFSNANYLKSTGDIAYAGQGINLAGSFVNYQAINTTLVNTPLPYRVLPRINLNLNHSFNFMPLDTAMDNEYVYFQQASLVDGQRVNAKPSISIPLRTASSYFTPKLSLQQTNYFINNISPSNPTPSSISRTVPLLSADTGTSFERSLRFGNSDFLHTLEPRLFYLYVPYTNQKNIPVFDTAQYDFQYYTLFRDNSFSSSDRIQDANQVTAALTSRLIDDKSGLERLKLNIGEIFYFRNRDVTLDYGNQIAQGIYNPLFPANYNPAAQGSYKQTNNYSNLVTELSSEITRQWSVTSGLQWNPQAYDINTGLQPINVHTGIQRVNAGIHFATKNNEIFNVGYLYRANPLVPDGSNNIKQVDTSFRYPIYDNWSAMGRWQYSLLYNKTQDAFFGIEKENCCWRFRIAVRHYINNLANTNNTGVTNNTLTGTPQNGIFFEFELKGLSSLGDDMDNFLRNEIYGYRGYQK
ncbi:MAG: LPS assembly protein LptD [Methylococcales bacterium]